MRDLDCGEPPADGDHDRTGKGCAEKKLEICATVLAQVGNPRNRASRMTALARPLPARLLPAGRHRTVSYRPRSVLAPDREPPRGGGA